MPPAPTRPLLDLLAASRLLPAGRLAAAARLNTPDLAGELVRRGWLTYLQARWLARGREPVVGQYALLETLGRGGQGRVVLARHLRLDRLAAVKFGRPDPARPDQGWGRFAREVRTVARLDHPHVVRAYDAGIRWGVVWLALEYVPGPDLGRLVAASGAVDPGVACLYACQALFGLQHLHDRGVVHRDVKPSNLGLAAGGRVKVLDVGLARTAESAVAGLTRAGAALGSADYAAPEQLADPRRAGPAADLYGLGCTLYHLLAGRVPFPGGTGVEKAVRHLTEEPDPVEAGRPAVPPAVAAVVRRLMAKRPRDRFRSAAEAAAAVAAVAPPPGAAVHVPATPSASGDPPASETAAGSLRTAVWTPRG